MPGAAPGAEPHAGASTAEGAPAGRPLTSLLGKKTPHAERREYVYNWVWRRRVAYFATLAVTLALLAMPLVAPGTGACKGALCWLAVPIAALEHVLPSFASAWTRSLSSHPDVGLSLLAALGFGLWRGGVLERRVRDEMRRVWYAFSMLRPGSVTRVPAPAAPGVVLRAIEELRRCPAYRMAFRALTHGVLPTGFLVALAFVVAALGSQVWFAMRASAGALCRAGDAVPAQAVGVGIVSVFDTRSPCAPTGLTAVEGATYRVRITVPAGLRWVDGATTDTPIPAGPNGFECRLPASTALRMAAGVPLRRHLTESWFQPMVRIDTTGNDGLLTRGANVAPTPANVSQEAFRRTKQAFKVDEIPRLGLAVDREVYGAQDGLLALYRPFLEPSKLPMSDWSMSVNSIDSVATRSLTHTFGDVFDGKYRAVIEQTLRAQPGFGALTCAQLQAASFKTFDDRFKADPKFFDR